MTEHGFQSTDIRTLEENAFRLIGQDWMLVTAQKPDGTYNTMTASWGGVGVLWNRPVAFVFIRPQRYTHTFTEASDRMTLSFFTEQYRPALKFCGAKSGRDYDKAAETGLTPISVDGSTAFREARLILSCRKLYADEIREDAILDPSILDNYTARDFHRMYVVEIEAAYQKTC